MLAAELHARRVPDELRARIAAAYPLCARVIPGETNRYLTRFCDLRPNMPDQADADSWAEVIRFGEFLCEHLALDGSGVGYSADLCRYETLLNELCEHQGLTRRADGGNGRWTWAQRPRRAAHVRLARLSFDIPAIVRSLEDTGAARLTSPRRTSVVFRAAPGSMFPELFRISERLADVLERCAGEQRADELAAPGGDAARRALIQLATMGLVEFA
jgi:hypothetical protein